LNVVRRKVAHDVAM